MRYYNIGVIGFLSLCLGGCKTTQPDPRIDDTIIENPPAYWVQYGQKIKKVKKSDKQRKEKSVRVTQEEPVQKFFDGLYDPEEVSVQIFFAFDSVNLSERDKKVLQAKIANPLRQKKNKILLLVGHSDWRGTPAYNEKLGERRAQKVAQFLQSLGIAPERMEIFSLGSRYATPNLSKPAGLKDRRCDIVILEI